MFHHVGAEETERQRDRETERQRNRETERQRDRETERQRDRETERQRDRETERQRDRETEREGQRDRETERQRNRETETERQRDRETEGQGDRETERERERRSTGRGIKLGQDVLERKRGRREPMSDYQYAAGCKQQNSSALVDVAKVGGACESGQSPALGRIVVLTQDSPASLHSPACWKPFSTTSWPSMMLVQALREPFQLLCT